MIPLAALFLLSAHQGNIEVPFFRGEDALIIQANVNGRKVSLMFDTGFGGSVDVSNTVNVGEVTGNVTLRDFVGESEAPTVKIKTLKIGDKTVDSTGMEAVMSRPEDYTSSYGAHCDGLMGLAVIKNNITEINFEKQKFVFYPNSFDISALKPDNKRTFLVKMLPMGTNAIKLAVEGPDKKHLIMALDTGNSFFATTHRDSLERIGLWEVGKEPKFTSMAGIASGAVVSWNKRMSNMTIFGVSVPQSTWDIIDLPSSSADSDGTVGYQFLKNFNIIIDYSRRYVWLENWTGKIAQEAVGDAGLAAAYFTNLKKVLVYHVTPDGPADQAGIKKGDELLSIDTTDFDGAISHKKLAKMLVGTVGSKIKLSISHQGALKRYELERKELVNE